MTASQSIDFASFDPEAQPPGSKRAYYLDVAELPSGDTLRLAALVAKGAEPGPTLVALGGVHGDEYEGPHAVRLAFDALDTGRMAGSFVGVPQCNVPAFAAGTRTSPIDGLNLARIFPGDAQGTITERIAYNLGEHVIAGCDFLIDLHSSGAPTAIAPLIGYYRATTITAGSPWRPPWPSECPFCGATRTSVRVERCPTPTRGRFPGSIPNRWAEDGSISAMLKCTLTESSTFSSCWE